MDECKKLKGEAGVCVNIQKTVTSNTSVCINNKENFVKKVNISKVV